MSQKWVRIWNIIACIGHLAMTIAALTTFDASVGNPNIFVLKVDRMQVVPRLDLYDSRIVVHDVLQLHAPFSNKTVSKNGVSLNQECGVADNNVLRFNDDRSSTGKTELETYTVPKNADLFVDPRLCVLMFHLLSFLFQSFVELVTLFSRPGKTWLGGFNWKNILWDKNPYLIVENTASPDADLRVQAFQHILSCNWLRFVEYSASGSLVLFTAALFSGVYDAEILILMFVAAAVCMVLGIVCEFCLRAWDVLNYMTQRELMPFMNQGAALKSVIVDIQWKVWYGALISHVLGWICIIVPWIFIKMRYDSWWSPCSAVLDTDAAILDPFRNTGSSNTDNINQSREKPPDFVGIVVVSEIVLYASFGLVQLYQVAQVAFPKWFPRLTNNTIEFIYIFLSVFAKTLIGAFLFANVLFST